MNSLNRFCPVSEYEGKLEKDLYLLLDANFIMTGVTFGVQNELFDWLTEHNVGLSTLLPVTLELYNTNSSEERAKRQLVIEKYGIVEESLNELTRKDYVKEVQTLLATANTYPSVIDLFLGAFLYMRCKSTAKYYLVTSNVKDFPSPFFIRKPWVILENDKTSTTFYQVVFNKEFRNK